MALTGVNVGLFLMGAVIVSFFWGAFSFSLIPELGFLAFFPSFLLIFFFGKTTADFRFARHSAGSDSTPPARRSTPTPRAPGAASPAPITPDRLLLETLEWIVASYATVQNTSTRTLTVRFIPAPRDQCVAFYCTYLPLCDLI